MNVAFIVPLVLLTGACASTQSSYLAAVDHFEGPVRYRELQPAQPGALPAPPASEGMTLSHSDIGACFRGLDETRVCPARGTPLLSAPAAEAADTTQDFAAQAYRKDVPECYSGSQMVPCEPPDSHTSVAEDSPESLP